MIVTCPAKTRELVEKWHTQRLYHLQKANPLWAPEQVEEEFAQDDSRVGTILTKIVEDIEAVIVKNRVEREADEKARAARLAAMKARLNERRDEPRSAKRPRVSEIQRNKAEEKRKKILPLDSMPQEFVERQEARLAARQQKCREMDEQYKRVKDHWKQELESLQREAQRYPLCICLIVVQLLRGAEASCLYKRRFV